MERKSLLQQYISVITENYANFNGRARRREYWGFILFNSIVSNVLTFTFASIDETLALVGTIYSLAVIVPTIAVAVRRMHDVGKSGWFMLIPIYNFILAVTDSEEGTNEYGPNPKNPANELDEIGEA